MIEVSMSFPADSFEAQAKLFEQTLGEEVRKVMLVAGVEHESEILRDLRAGTGGLKLGGNESGMRSSFKHEVTGSTVEDLKLSSFSNSKVARAHELGANIKPKQAKYLTIPMPAAKTKGGRRRGNARSYKDAHFVRKGAKIYLVGKEGVLFHLVKSAVIPKRPFFFRVWEKLADRRLKQMGDAVTRALGRFGQ